MTYALVADIPASWERYAGLVPLLLSTPTGLLLHVAGPTDEGFRIIEVWQSEAEWRRFEPVLTAAVAAIDEDVHPGVTVRDLHGEHELLDHRWAHVVSADRSRSDP